MVSLQVAIHPLPNGLRKAAIALPRPVEANSATDGFPLHFVKAVEKRSPLYNFRLLKFTQPLQCGLPPPRTTPAGDRGYSHSFPNSRVH